MKQSKTKWLVGIVSSFSLAAILVFFSLPLKGHIPVLMYHFIVPESEAGNTSLLLGVKKFHMQMWFLKTFGFRLISLDEFYAIKTGDQKPRGREVVVTFDDGDETYLYNALPILERYQIPSVNFVVWDYMEKEEQKSINLQELKQLSQYPLVTIGSQDLSNPNLREVSREQARAEIFLSKEKLEKALNRRIDYFAYPIGSFDESIMALVQEAGYRLAFRTRMKYLTGYPETMYSLARIKAHPKHNLFVFWLYVSGFDSYAKRIEASFLRLTGYHGNDKLAPYQLIPETTQVVVAK